MSAAVFRSFLDPSRTFGLIDQAIARLEVDLSGLRVLTEAASGAYVVTSLIAARAGAARVYAVARSSEFGSATSVVEYGRVWAKALGVAERIEFSLGPASEHASQTDLVTNLGFVRPIDAALASRLPPHAAVALMCEPWEVRRCDVDVDACEAAGIAVVGTNETDSRLHIFDYVGVLAVKLVMEAGLEVFRSRIVVIGSDPFGTQVESKLTALGADVIRVPLPDSSVDLDAHVGEMIAGADALVLSEHRERRELVGHHGGIRPSRFTSGWCRLVHVAGSVDDASLADAGVRKYPGRCVAAGHMTVATDYVGPRPAVDLHAAGLAAGALAVRVRLRGGSMLDAVAAAEASGLGARVSRVARN